MTPSEGQAPIIHGGDGSAPGDDLRYEIQLWALGGETVERVLGRAATASLARAIFDAARGEHLGRRITLRAGDEIVADTR